MCIWFWTFWTTFQWCHSSFPSVTKFPQVRAEGVASVCPFCVARMEGLFIFSFFSFNINTQETDHEHALATFSLYWQVIHEQEVVLSLKKATAEAFRDLQTFVTNGMSSLTLSCLSKTNPHSKQHPSVLVEHNDKLPFRCTQSIWILSLFPFFHLW